MRIYFAGEGFDKEVLGFGATRLLKSYYYIEPKWMPEYLSNDLLVDSGGYTAQVKGTIIDVRDYAKFLNKWDVKTAFNLDTNNIEESLRNQKYLEQETKCYIIPVYHPLEFLSPDYKDLIDKYVANYPYISAGGIVSQSIPQRSKELFLNYIFSKTRDKTKVHGLGVTSKKYLKRYPFYSVDSTAWQTALRYGGTIVPRYKGVIQKVRSKKLHYKTRVLDEIKSFLDLETYFTDLWETRGIKWD